MRRFLWRMSQVMVTLGIKGRGLGGICGRETKEAPSDGAGNDREDADRALSLDGSDVGRGNGLVRR